MIIAQKIPESEHKTQDFLSADWGCPVDDESLFAGRFEQALAEMPESGGGGLHQHLLTCANLGCWSGYSPEHIFSAIRRAVDRAGGPRPVPDNEIHKTIATALRGDGPPIQTAPRPVFDAEAVRAALIERGKGFDEAAAFEASPVRLLGEPRQDAALLLKTLYYKSDLLFCGAKDGSGGVGKLGSTIRTAGQWIKWFEAGRGIPEFIICNPLSGKAVPKKDKPDEVTYRADGCVKVFRFALCESDELSIADQLSFLAGSRLPIYTLIHSGKKSIHAWLRVDGIESAEQWHIEIWEKLFHGWFKPLGIDSSCCNPSRLSRLPGHRRTAESFQRLLFLDPQGRALPL